MEFLNLIALFFLLFLGVVIYRNRENLKVEGIFIMWRTKKGLDLMDKLAKIIKRNKLFLNTFIFTMFLVSFIAFLYITYYLIDHTIKLLTKQTDIPGLSLVIPGVTSIGGIKIPFWTILIIFLVALVHEMGHGIVARIWNLKLKSTGLVLLAIIPGAFVEIDEKELEKKKLKEKLSVLMAGPFFNIIFALISLIFLKLISLIPINYYGANYISYNPDLPNGTLLMINNKPITYSNLNEAVSLIRQEVKNCGNISLIIKTKENNIIQKEIKPIKKNNSCLLGVSIYSNCELSNNKPLCDLKNSLFNFFFFLFIFNLGIGLANLIPLIPLDGGKILYFLIGKYKYLFVFVNILMLILILLNLLYPLYKKFL